MCAQQKRLTVLFVKDLRDDSNSVLDGLYNCATNTLSVNADLGFKAKFLTVFHELGHYLNHKLFSLRATPILNNMIDVANFLVEKNNLITLIKAKFGPKSLKKAINSKIAMLDYYNKLYWQIRLLKESKKEKQAKLSDFSEFKPIVENFEKSLKAYHDYLKELKNESKAQIKSDLCRFREKRTKKGSE